MQVDKIIQGDSYELIKKLPDKSIDLIVTDPPYEFTKNKWFRNSERYVSVRKDLGDEMAESDCDKGVENEMLYQWCRVMKKINIFIWCNKWQLMQYMHYFIEEKKCNFEILIWAKNNPIPLCNGTFLHDKEYCLYFWETGAKVNLNTYKKWKTVFFSSLNQKDKAKYGHPTIKPLEIIEKLVEIGSERGGIVLDTFLGSGTTALACKELGRHYIGFEKDARWVAVARERVEGVIEKKEESYTQNKLF